MNKLSLAVIALSACGPRIDPGPIAAEIALRPVRLVASPSSDAPDIYLAAIVAAGSAYDPVGSEGLAYLTARSLVEAGAGDRSSEEVREALFPTGSHLELVVDREWVSLRLRCHRDDAEACVGLFLDALARPRLDGPDVARLAEQQLQQLTDGMLADEERLGRELLEASLYEGHRYGHPPEGRAGVLSLLDAEDVRRFYERHYVREAMVVGLAGGFDDATRERLEEGLLKIAPQRGPELPLMAPEPLRGRSLVAVDTETPVTGIHLGQPIALDRNDPDWAAMWVATTALGAHRQSFGRLFRVMRAEHGLNYGDYAYIEPHLEQSRSVEADQGILRRQNRFVLWIRPTSLEDGPFALKLAVDELSTWVRDGLQPEEFSDIRGYLRSHLPLLAPDPGRRLLFAMDAEATGTPDLLRTLPEALDALTVEEVNAAIGRHVDPSQLRAVVVSGEAAAFVDAVLGDAPTLPSAADPTLAERDAATAALDLGLERDRTVVLEAGDLFR